MAPNANLHSVGVQSTSSDSDVAIGLNKIAILGGGNVRAINMSFHRALQPFVEEPDGDSHLAQFVDWSASRHDVLYVASWGNDGDFEFRTPSDNFNGVTVAASEPMTGPDIVYHKFWEFNATEGDATGERTSIDLLAPGAFIRVLETGDNEMDHEAVVDGTSYAAPHVTGAVALLQQYAQNQINASNPRFNGNSQRHEVMKAVMLNSADKLEGVHGSRRTILDSAEQDWAQSEAFNTQFQSLDDEMGAGHLNVRRAIGQFASGEYDPGPVPLIGWNTIA